MQEAIVVRNPLTAAVLGFAARLRFPTLFAVTAGLFVLDLLIPDVIPLVDELLLGLAALVLASLRKKASPRRA